MQLVDELEEEIDHEYEKDTGEEQEENDEAGLLADDDEDED